MRLLLLLSFFSCLYITDAAAQKKKYKINPGEKIAEKIPKGEIYSYPEFMEGKVYLKNNTYSLVKMNYNSLYGEMQFINPKGDTFGDDLEKLIRYFKAITPVMPI